MTDWQPIETAPKDQTIMLYRPAANEWFQVAPGKWDTNDFHARPKPYWSCPYGIAFVYDCRAFPPSHWQPLPPPPENDND
jgi:hypothetical protein